MLDHMNIALMSEKILRLPGVIDRTGLKRTSIYDQIAAGTFPKQVKIGPRAVGWYQSAIDEWIRQRGENTKRAA
jgi:prophage regulatory protein